MEHDLASLLQQLRPDEVDVDGEGRVVIANPKLAAKIRDIIATHAAGPSLVATTNSEGCVNIICGEEPQGGLGASRRIRAG